LRPPRKPRRWAPRSPSTRFLPFFIFAALLLAIRAAAALDPGVVDQNRNKGIVAAACALPIAIYMVAMWGHAGFGELVHTTRDYTSFLLLLARCSSFTSGIVVKGSLSGTPHHNSALLLIGALLASVIGTTEPRCC